MTRRGRGRPRRVRTLIEFERNQAPGLSKTPVAPPTTVVLPAAHRVAHRGHPNADGRPAICSMGLTRIGIDSKGVAI